LLLIFLLGQLLIESNSGGKIVLKINLMNQLLYM